jgi:hypothetical protein
VRYTPELVDIITDESIDESRLTVADSRAVLLGEDVAYGVAAVMKAIMSIAPRSRAHQRNSVARDLSRANGSPRERFHAHAEVAESGQFPVSVRPRTTAQSPRQTFADVKD